MCQVVEMVGGLVYYWGYVEVVGKVFVMEVLYGGWVGGVLELGVFSYELFWGIDGCLEFRWYCNRNGKCVVVGFWWREGVFGD